MDPGTLAVGWTERYELTNNAPVRCFNHSYLLFRQMYDYMEVYCNTKKASVMRSNWPVTHFDLSTKILKKSQKAHKLKLSKTGDVFSSLARSKKAWSF